MNIFKLQKNSKRIKNMISKLVLKEVELGVQIEKEENKEKKDFLINQQSQIQGQIQKLIFNHNNLTSQLDEIKTSPKRNSLPLKKQRKLGLIPEINKN